MPRRRPRHDSQPCWASRRVWERHCLECRLPAYILTNRDLATAQRIYFAVRPRGVG